MGKGHRKGWKKAQRKMEEKPPTENVPNLRARPKPKGDTITPQLSQTANSQSQCIWKSIKEFSFPTFKWTSANAAEIVGDILHSPLFQIILCLILFVLTYVKAVSVAVAVAIAVTWFVCVFGIARYPRIRQLKTRVRWGITLGCAIALLFSAVKFNRWAIDQVAHNDNATGVLFPPSDKSLGSGGLIRMEIGSSKSGLDLGQPFLGFAREDNFLGLKRVHGQILVSTTVRDRNGNVIARMADNEWQVGTSIYVFDRNFNSNSLEIIDSKGDVVFQIRIFQDHLELQGRWRSRTGSAFALVEVDGRGCIEVGPPGYEFQHQIRPIFRYPSQLHFGELIR